MGRHLLGTRLAVRRLSAPWTLETIAVCLVAAGCGGADNFQFGDGGGDAAADNQKPPPMCPPGTNYQTDPQNCGGCGVVCTGGACTAGICALIPPSVTPPPVGDFACLAVDANNVYWATGLGPTNGGAVYKVPLSGGTPALVAGMQQNPHGIASNGQSLFWTTLAGTIMKSDTNGGGAAPIVSSQPGPVWLVIDKASVYWTNNGDGSVWKAGQDGSSPTKLAAAGMGHAGRLAVDATDVYVGDPTGGTVYRVPIAGGQMVTMATGQSSPRGISVEKGFLYWANTGQWGMGNGSIMKLGPLGQSGIMPIVLAKSVQTPTGLVAEGPNVWWAQAAPAAAGAIVRMPVGGGPQTMLASNQSEPDCVALDWVSVYWINLGSGTPSKTGK